MADLNVYSSSTADAALDLINQKPAEADAACKRYSGRLCVFVPVPHYLVYLVLLLQSNLMVSQQHATQPP